MLEFRKRDIEKRESVVDLARGVIVDSKLLPRRLWDLYSNRVIERWMVGQEHWKPGVMAVFECNHLYAVSHSWMDEGFRNNVDTPINGHQWPVPVPVDTTLERLDRPHEFLPRLVVVWVLLLHCVLVTQARNLWFPLLSGPRAF